MTQDSELVWTCVQDSRLSLNPHSLVVGTFIARTDGSHIPFRKMLWQISPHITHMEYLTTPLLSPEMSSAG